MKINAVLVLLIAAMLIPLRARNKPARVEQIKVEDIQIDQVVVEPEEKKCTSFVERSNNPKRPVRNLFKRLRNR